MRSIILVFLVTACSSVSFGQQTPDPQKIPKTAADYSAKSHDQKSGAFVCLGITGIAIAIAAPGKVGMGASAVIGGIGLVTGIVSVPLFIAAGRNKRKAKLMMSSQSISYGYPYGRKQVNGISLKIPLGK